MPSSLFNDVLGPIMIGSSSSHTAAPGRIGLVGYQLLGGEPAAITVRFDHKGSFAACYNSQGSDFGFTGGLLGISISDPRLRDALQIAAAKGIPVVFEKTHLKQVIHPNQAEIELVSPDDGMQMYMTAISTGGGMFEVISFMGMDISISGDCYDTLILVRKEQEAGITAVLKEERISPFLLTEQDQSILIQIKTYEPMQETTIEKLNECSVWVRCVEPVLPVVKRKDAVLPFMNADEAQCYATEQQLSVSELAVKYEATISGKTPEELNSLMDTIIAVMRESALHGIRGDFADRGFLPKQVAGMAAFMQETPKRFIDMGLLSKAFLWATGAIEYDIGRGRCVAAPTGGSCGVLPGSIISIGEDLGKSSAQIRDAMLAAGLVGVFISDGATFAAETGGCQAENGSASAMAAAGIVQMMGGTVKEVFAAASLAIENVLGLICDPVAGVGNIPCISRNAMATMNAVLSANMVLAGFDPYISLDESIAAMRNAGELMHEDLRCTGRGGLCITKEGKAAERTWQALCQACQATT